MFPSSLFYFIPGMYLSNHLKYFNDTLQDYAAGQCRVSHAPNEDSVGKSGFCGITMFLVFSIALY